MLKQLSTRTKDRLEKTLFNTGDMALKRRARRIIEELELHNGDRILDVGCGDGYYLHLLSNLELNLKLTGVDFDSEGLKSARNNLKDKKIRLVKADLMNKLPFKSNFFDKAIMSEVAEHLPDDVKGVNEVRRVLKKGGVLCLSVPNANYPFLWDPVNWVLEHFFDTHVKSGFWAGLWNQHIRLYKPFQIKKTVERAGFKIEVLESLTWWSLPFNHNIINLGARMLHGGVLSPKVSASINKYTKKVKRPFYVDLFFGLVNRIDKLNDLFIFHNHGVGVFVKARK